MSHASLGSGRRAAGAVGRTAFLLLSLLSIRPSLVASGDADGRTGGRTADHVVLISIDALRPEFYLDRSWPAPMLQQMALEGAHARGAVGVYPTVTYPSHTSIVTGVLPSSHGIHYNSPFEPGGTTGRWYWEEERIRVRTLWDAARAAGLTIANLSWPVTVGAPIDWNLPEIWSISSAETAIDVLRRASSPPGLWEEIERQATGRLTMENFHIDWITRDARAGDIAAYLLIAKRPNLLLVHLIEVDHFQHEDGRDSPRVRRALATADSAVSQIVEAAERAGMLDRTTFLVTGDHGMIDLDSRLAPNVWLADAGLRGREELGEGWRATFHTTSASAFLHLADPTDTAALSEVRAILAAVAPEFGDRFRLLERDELDRLGAAPDAALGLALAPGTGASASAMPPAVQPASGATHGYLPTHARMKTGFVAWGAGIRPQTVLAEVRLVDVAPLVVRLLELEMSGATGRLPAVLADEPGRRGERPRPLFLGPHAGHRNR